MAALQGRVATVRSLLATGMHPSAPSLDGMTPLHRAATRGQTDAIAALLAAGANPDASAAGFRGYTPLHMAGMYGHAGAVRLLAGAGAGINPRSSTGATPLVEAAASGHEAAVAALLELGADTELAAEGFRTPLHAACEAPHSGGVGSVTRLLRAGARMTDPGRLVFEASLSRNLPAVVALLDRGAGTQYACPAGGGAFPRVHSAGQTPLHVASARSAEVTAELCCGGAPAPRRGTPRGACRCTRRARRRATSAHGCCWPRAWRPAPPTRTA